MSEVLTAAPEGPQTDQLVEQVETPRAPELKTSEEPKPSLDETLKAEVDKALKEAKSDKDEKPAKAEEEPKAKVKEEPKAKEAKPADEAASPEPKAEKPDDASADDAQDANSDDGKSPRYREAPRGFDEAAKAEWENVPESVRGAVYRRQQEMESGLTKYRDQIEPLRKYADMAEQGGTDLPTALARYTEMENALRQNPLNGLQAVIANLDLKKSDGNPVTLRDVAATVMGQTPDKAAAQQDATIANLTKQVQTLTQQLGGFSEHVQQQQHQAKVSSAEGEWSSFKSENPRAAELEGDIAKFMTKYPAPDTPAQERLQDAYDWAVSRNPSDAHTVAPPLVQTQANPQPNPAGKKSISGAGGESRTVRKESSEEAIKKAISKIRA